MTKLFVGDTGTDFIVDVGSSILTATTTDLKVTKPDGTEVTWSGAIESGSFIKYTSLSGDLNVPGIYKIQAYVVMSGWTGHGEIAEFKVHPVLH